MSEILLGLWLAVQGLEGQTVAVPPRARVEIVNHAGHVVVTTGSRSEVRVEADAPVEVSVSGAVVEIAFATAARPGESRRLQVVVPADAAVNVAGWATDIDVENAGGDVIVNSHQGEIAVTGAKGPVSVNAIDGLVRLRGAAGRVNIHTVTADVDAQSIAGDLTVETVSGDIGLGEITGNIRALTTLSGAVTINGSVGPATRTEITTHSGSVIANIRGTVNATITIIAPPRARVTATGFRFEEKALDRFFLERRVLLGSGSGVLTVRTFEGAVTLVTALAQ